MHLNLQFLFYCLLLQFIKVSLAKINENVHAFFYLWYGNPEIDGGEYKHWNHKVLPHWEERVNSMYPQIGHKHFPPDDLHSPFYPLRGPYSSSDPLTINAQFEELLLAGINTIVISWWGQPTNPAATDSQGVNTDAVIPLLLNTADTFHTPINIIFHLEPYPSRTIETLRDDIIYLFNTYSHHKSFYKDQEHNNLPLFYIYDSYHIETNQWKRLLDIDGDITIRNTEYDGIFLGLWLEPHHGRDLKNACFDGIYTYFAIDGFSYGSSTRHWRSMCSYVRHSQEEYSRLRRCVLSVGPGYNDTSIRPWNFMHERSRNGGKYYADMWEAALRANPTHVSITSFNEWGEGTQIEPAVHRTQGKDYLDYGADGDDDDAYKYIHLTAAYGDIFQSDPVASTHEDL